MQKHSHHEPIEEAIEKMLGLRAEDFSDRPAIAFSDAIKTFGSLDSAVKEIREGADLLAAGLESVTDRGLEIRRAIESVPGEMSAHVRLVREDIEELRDEINDLAGNAADHAETLSEIVVDARLALSEAASELREVKALIDRQSGMIERQAEMIERQQMQIEALVSVAKRNNEARRGFSGFFRAVFG